MQNRYVGDVGDFGKYGLLRALCNPGPGDSGAPLKLGVIWYLVPDETRTNDGRHVNYLTPTKKNLDLYRNCDPGLYDTLKRMVRSGSRNIRSIQESGLFPQDTVFYDAVLDYYVIRLPGRQMAELRKEIRHEWFKGALEATAECDVVFVDPDNGLSSETGHYERRGNKYVFYEELAEFTTRGQNLVIYHHLGRQATAVSQIRLLFKEIGLKLSLDTPKWGLHYHRGTARVFQVIPTSTYERLLTERVCQFSNSQWGMHFDLLGSNHHG
jgi:hypothetical protein